MYDDDDTDNNIMIMRKRAEEVLSCAAECITMV